MRMTPKQISKGEISVTVGKSVIEDRLTPKQIRQSKNRLKLRRKFSKGDTNLAGGERKGDDYKSLEATLAAELVDWEHDHKKGLIRTQSSVSKDTLALLSGAGVSTDSLIEKEVITPDSKLKCYHEPETLGTFRPLAGAKYDGDTLVLDKSPKACGKQARPRGMQITSKDDVDSLHNACPSTVAVQVTREGKTFMEPMKVNPLEDTYAREERLSKVKAKEAVKFTYALFTTKFYLSLESNQRIGVFKRCIQMVEVEGVNPEDLPDNCPYKEGQYSKLWRELSETARLCYQDLKDARSKRALYN